jgi:hypothetical protein
MDAAEDFGARSHRPYWRVVVWSAAVLNVCVCLVANSFWFMGPPDPSRLWGTVVVFSLYTVVAVVAVLGLLGARRQWKSSVVNALDSASVQWAALMTLFMVVCVVFRVAV